MKRRDFLKSAGAGGAVAAGTLAAPAIVQARTEITICSTWGRDFPGLGTSAQRLAQNITDATDGRLYCEYFAANERVKAFDSFDEAQSGNSQAYIAADYYWKGKHPAWAYFTAVPFGLTYSEINAWIRFGGGQELWDEVAGNFNLKCMPAGNTGCQMGGWFRKEINSADDIKGLKMRIPGLGGDVIAKLGGSSVSLPGGQIYENLVAGSIDATEWVGPWNDEFYKFYEAAKYYYYPGMHEPGSMISMGWNKDFWEGLSKSDQALITAVAGLENDLMMSEYNWNSGAALNRLVNEQGVQLRQFNDDVYDSFAEAADEVFEEIRAHSDLAERVHSSFLSARSSLGTWLNLSDMGFLTQRNRALGL